MHTVQCTQCMFCIFVQASMDKEKLQNYSKQVNQSVEQVLQVKLQNYREVSKHVLNFWTSK